MRGKGRTTRPAPARARITPAYAGKRPPRRTGRCAGWDHPRVCGEKITRPSSSSFGMGSPPHVRGKADLALSMSAVQRITPACAGKRQALAKALSRSRDHPRMCGEKESARPARPAAWGSPPHVRGKGFFYFAHKVLERITPACAGKSPWALRRPGGRRDHPRMCGEKPDCKAKRNPKKGSPPHVRGKD